MASREPELYKDKIEVNLDGRQIFYLFFGGSVIVGLVFVLGVMVGRRVEARGHTDRAHTAANVDPLAALDRLEGSGGLQFQGALSGTGGPAVPGDVEKTIGDLAAKKGDGGKPAAKADDGAAAAAKDKKDAAAVAAAKEEKEKAAKEKKEKDEAAAAARKKEEIAANEKAARAANEKSDKSEKSDKDKPEKSEKVRYTLQLSSFQDKGEAQAFLDSLKSAGYQAYLTEAEVDGKGTFYRIRYGKYGSLDAATDAKAEIEKAAHKSASIMKL
jgi:cell division septation protein DedD